MKCNIVCTALVLLFLVTDETLQQEADALEYGRRVVGGHDANWGELPFQVTIQRKFYFGNGSFHWCGGSIIDSEHVLTAGHCVYGLPTAELIVYAGVLNNTWQSSESTKVVRNVTDVYLHEGFVYDIYLNDIAIIKVSPAFPTDNPALTAIPLTQDNAPEGTNCTVSGWGLLGDPEETYSEALQVVTVPFISHDKCRHIYSNYTYGSLEPGMICAGYLEGGKDACKGDSGGPLQCDGLLTGIVSWGVGCAQPNYPGVYTDLVYYKDWIATQLAKSKTTHT